MPCKTVHFTQKIDMEKAVDAKSGDIQNNKKHNNIQNYNKGSIDEEMYCERFLQQVGNSVFGRFLLKGVSQVHLIGATGYS